MSITFTSDRRGLVIKTPYSVAFVQAIQEMKRAGEASFTGKPENAWIVDPKHATEVQRLIMTCYGVAVAIPKIDSTNGHLVNHVLRIEYLGTCKERADGRTTATGHDGQGWNVVIAETVLRTFFGDVDSKLIVDGQPNVSEAKQTLYQILLLKPEATGDDVKRGYRRLAIQWHPDKCGEPEAQERFIAIKHAYDVLSDGVKRRRYDAGLALEAAYVKREGDAARRLDRWARRNGVNLGGYRSPLRCGLLTVDGEQKLGRVHVDRIHLWDDIVREDGKVMTSSWSPGAESYEVNWL